jgi:hypothetical protein
LLALVLVIYVSACEPESSTGGSGVSSDASTVLELQPYVGRLVTVTGRLNGDSLRLLFDSGGGETLLAPRVADDIPCVPAGRSVGFRMSGERVEWPLCKDVSLELGGQTVVDSVSGIWDVMSILPEGLPRLDGIVSLETFRDRLLTLNLAESTLTLHTEETFRERVRTMIEVPMRLATGNDGSHLTVLLEGRLPGSNQSTWLLLDSGNLAETLLAAHVRDEDAPSDATIVFSDSLAITAPARTADIIYDGALSEAFLRQLVVTLDLGRGRAWVAPAS